MTSDLLTQLADYGEYCEERQGSVAVDEVKWIVTPDHPGSLAASVDTAVQSVEAEPDDQRVDDLMVDYLQQRPDESDASSERRGWSRVVVAVAATILVVVGVVVVADGHSGDVLTDPASSPTVSDPPVSSPDAADPAAVPSVTDPASSPSVSVPAAPRAVAEPVPPLWPLVFRDQAGRSYMSDVVAGGPGFVAIGHRGGNAAVWTSVDGLAWSRVPRDEAAFGDSYISAVTTGGPGLVAVGSEGNLEEDRRGPAAVWTSVDGLAWSRVPHDEAAFGEAAGMGSVTVGGPGLVAVGSVGNDGDADAAVWTSIDGLTWSRVPHDETTFGGAGKQSMKSVTAGGPGLVAVGYDGQGSWDNSGGQDAAVWTSVDGLTWSRVPHDEDAFGGDDFGPAMLGVTTGGPGLVAVGYSFGFSAPAAVWTSVDGLTWSRVSHDNGAELSGTMWSVDTGGPGLVAVGSNGNDAGSLWTSVDGLTWSLAAYAEADTEPGTLGGSRMSDHLSAANGRLVAVGSLNPYAYQGSQAAAVWTSPDP